MYKEEFMKKAIEEASVGVDNNNGGPFGAVRTKDDKIIATGHNMVLSTNDPTNHAEIVAIRKASENLGRYDLSDCEIYASCEPCPMCLSAIYWARIPIVYYAANSHDAEKAGFDDKRIYDFFIEDNHVIKLENKPLINHLLPFEKWNKKQDKQIY